MYTKEDLKEYLKAMGLTGKETILVHSSMKSIGEVEGRADTVLDAWIEYFGHGLLLLPTHTWKNINADSPVYNPKETPSCVGLLTNMFLKRDGVIRSLHPTHSMAGIGEKAAEYLAGDTDSSSMPIARNASVISISAPSSPQIPIQMPFLCALSAAILIRRSRSL